MNGEKYLCKASEEIRLTFTRLDYSIPPSKALPANVFLIFYLANLVQCTMPVLPELVKLADG